MTALPLRRPNVAAALRMLTRRPTPSLPVIEGPPGGEASAGSAHYAEAVKVSIRLDDEIGRKLEEAVSRTEASALAIMQQVRALCDYSAELSTRLQAADTDAVAFEQEVGTNVAALAQMTIFLQDLPGRLQRDLDNISLIAAEVKGLSDLAESVQTISMQSHLLSINAAIEASRAGASGHAFKVVAEEVRMLASNSHTAATRISTSLKRVNSVLKDGLEHNAARSANDLGQIAQTEQAVAQLRSSLKRVTGNYQARFADMHGLGNALSSGASEVLGQLQYQDVVRQCVERLREAVERRNVVLENGFSTSQGYSSEMLAAMLGDIVEEYLAAELLHGGSASAEDSGPAIELF